MSSSAATSSGVIASTWRMALTPMPGSVPSSVVTPGTLAPRRRRRGRVALAEDGAGDLGAE